MHDFSLWKMLFFQRIKLLYILAQHLKTCTNWNGSIFRCKSELFNLKYFSILSAQIIFWIGHIFVELSLDLKEVLVNLNSYLLLRTFWNKNHLHQNLAKSADESRSVKSKRNFMLTLESSLSFNLVNNHITAINNVICFQWNKFLSLVTHFYLFNEKLY